MLNRNRIVTVGLALALLASPVALTACGGSGADEDSDAVATESTSTEQRTDDTTTSQNSTTSDNSTSGSSGKTYSIATSEITEAYMGVAESGETVYYVGNGDGSKTGIFFLNTEKMAHVSFMGAATATDQNGERLITITDELSGNSITFGVTVNDDGTITIDMGSELGKATLAKCEVSEAVDAIKTIQGNTAQVG